jgi:general stress protein YciG
MSGSREGGLHTKETMIAQLGGEEAYRDFMRENGKLGGSVKTPKGFALDKERASAAGRLGGRNSSRKGVKNGQFRNQATSLPEPND